MAHGRQAYVLTLDDDEQVGAFVRAALPDSRFRTSWIGDVPSAIASVEKNPPDLALIDIDLNGGGSGWQLLRFLRANPDTANVPVVMLTGSSDTLNRERSLRMGADRYLIKPVRPDTLRRVVDEMLAIRDDMWWTMTLNTDQVARMRDLFVDPTTDVPTLAVVVDDLRKLIEAGETLEVFCIEIEPLFRIGERNLWESFDVLRREFVRGLHVMIGPILGNDVIIAVTPARTISTASCASSASRT